MIEEFVIDYFYLKEDMPVFELQYLLNGKRIFLTLGDCIAFNEFVELTPIELSKLVQALVNYFSNIPICEDCNTIKIVKRIKFTSTKSFTFIRD